MGPGRYQLGHHVGLGKGKIQNPAHVPDGTPRGHGAEGHDLGHMVCAVLSIYVVNNLAPAFLAEIRIEIRHADPLRVQEAFKNQAVFHGVHFGDVDAVGHNGTGTGTTARAHRDPRLLGVVNEIPDDEVIVHIAHGADDTDLILHPLSVFPGGLGVPLPEALVAEFPEVFFIGVSLRHRKGRKLVFVEGEFHVAHVRNFGRIFKGLVTAGKKRAEFFFAFQIKLLGFKPHPVQIVHGFAGLDAQ